ncbi:MAG: hypothetical protein NVSMB23_05990 [Myxococcales bacterium]
MTAAPLAFALALLGQALPPPGAERAPAGAAGLDAPVALHVRKVEPSVLAGARRAVSRAVRRLWEREEPAAAEGNARVAQNDVAGALRAYDEAEKAIPPAGEAAAALALNRSGALLKQGAEEAPQALAHALRALSTGSPETRAQAAYTTALALESAGKTDEAIAAYGRALALDPDDADAKVNLELLLRTEERKKKQPAPSAQDEQKKQQQKGDSSKEPQAKGEAPKKDEQKDPGEPRKDDGKAQGQPKKDEPAKDGDEKQAQREKKDPRGGQKQDDQKAPADPGDRGAEMRADAAGAQPLDRTEAQRLLDALRAGEKNLQIWRFGKRTQDARRRGTEKDW